VTFVDVEVHVDPESSLTFALVTDGGRVIHVLHGEGMDPVKDARRRAIRWAQRNHYIVTNARAVA
jgi:hypothetical protein